MILDGNGSICLVNWGHEVLLPHFYEFAAISCLNPYDEPYEDTLLQAVEQVMRLTEEEKRLVDMLHMARGLSLRYQFKDDLEEETQSGSLTGIAPPPKDCN